MQELKFFLGTILTSIVLFCVSVYFTMSSSAWFIIADLVTFFWIIVTTVFTFKWIENLTLKESARAVKVLNFSGILFLIAGLVNAVISLFQGEAVILTVIGLFCFCCFVLSLFFKSVIRYEKLRKNDRKWTERTNTVLVEQLL